MDFLARVVPPKRMRAAATAFDQRVEEARDAVLGSTSNRSSLAKLAKKHSQLAPRNSGLAHKSLLDRLAIAFQASLAQASPRLLKLNHNKKVAEPFEKAIVENVPLVRKQLTGLPTTGRKGEENRDQINYLIPDVQRSKTAKIILRMYETGRLSSHKLQHALNNLSEKAALTELLKQPEITASDRARILDCCTHGNYTSTWLLGSHEDTPGLSDIEYLFAIYCGLGIDFRVNPPTNMLVDANTTRS